MHLHLHGARWKRKSINFEQIVNEIMEILRFQGIFNSAKLECEVNGNCRQNCLVTYAILQCSPHVMVATTQNVTGNLRKEVAYLVNICLCICHVLGLCFWLWVGELGGLGHSVTSLNLVDDLTVIHAWKKKSQHVLYKAQTQLDILWQKNIAWKSKASFFCLSTWVRHLSVSEKLHEQNAERPDVWLDCELPEADRLRRCPFDWESVPKNVNHQRINR